MSQIASKNLYDLLGNDPELDPDRAPDPPTKVADNPVARIGKRNGGPDAPNGDRSSAGARGGRQQNITRADQAGNLNNRAEQKDDGLRQDRHRDRNRDPREHRGIEKGRGPRGDKGRGRGAYTGTRTARNDRQSHTGIGEHEKQAAHGWGGETAAAELTDEQAGDAIAAAELKNDPNAAAEAGSKDPAFSNGPDLANEDGAVAAVEDKTKSYDQYLAEQAEKRLALGGGLDIRKPNEGSKQKFPQGKAHEVDPQAENYFVGSGGKTRKEKEAKQKNVLTVDGQYYSAPAEERSSRGGRGGRGGRGRGEGRGEYRGRGGRGGRGDRGDRADRGSYRGDRGGFNANDQSAFPALGGN